MNVTIYDGVDSDVHMIQRTLGNGISGVPVKSKKTARLLIIKNYV
jgi:hypothetical protein